MESLGAYLKKVRESKGVTIEEIANITRIRAEFLKALENDDFDLFPADAFVKGFLRTYAKSVGLNPDEIVARYNNEISSDRKKNVEFEALKHSLARRGEKQVFFSRTGVVLLIMLIPIAFVYFLISDNYSFKGTPTKGTPTKTKMGSVTKEEKSPPAPLVEKKKPLPTADEKSVNEIRKKIEPENVIERVIAEEPGSVRENILTIEAIEEAWIYVVIDGDKKKDVMLKPGSKVRWKSEEMFLFTTGNLPGIQVMLNGKPVSFPAIRGKVLKDFVITKDAASP